MWRHSPRHLDTMEERNKAGSDSTHIRMAGQFLSKHVAVKQIESKTFRPRRSLSVTIRISTSNSFTVYRYVRMYIYTEFWADCTD